MVSRLAACVNILENMNSIYVWEGKVQDVKELDPKLFRQPEGICFSPIGDMYISNEGQGGKGYILKFNIHATQQQEPGS